MTRPRRWSGAESCMAAFEFADQAVKPAPTKKSRMPASRAAWHGASSRSPRADEEEQEAGQQSRLDRREQQLARGEDHSPDEQCLRGCPPERRGGQRSHERAYAEGG